MDRYLFEASMSLEDYVSVRAAERLAEQTRLEEIKCRLENKLRLLGQQGQNTVVSHADLQVGK